MKKRVLSFALIINFLFVFLSGKLYSLTVKPQTVDNIKSSREKVIASTRGMIYDRNLLHFTNENFTYTACIKPTTEALRHIRSINEAKSTQESVIKGQFTVKNEADNKLFGGCDDIKLLKVYKRYSNNSLIHILGYTDNVNKGACGIEKYYNNYLEKNGGTLSVVYSADAQNRVLLNEDIEIRDNGYYSGNGISLTIDKNIQALLENALKNNNIEKGAGVVLDAKTNEILACASAPVYDRFNLKTAVNDTRSPFINRAFSAYPVGSVFKVITAAAAIENNVFLNNFYCSGSIKKTENIFNCNKLEGHKKITFNEAMSQSCNPYFIELGVKTGGEMLLNTAKKLHLGESVDFGNEYMTDKGTLPTINELNFEADIGNLAFGQGKLTATPLQIAAIFSCIGNSGIYNTPTLIKGEVNSEGNLKEHKKSTGEQVLSKHTCDIIKKSLENTVIDGTGKSAHSDFFDSCSKTSTAQSGQYDKNGNEIKYCWFVGFFPKENPKYTICIMKENGVSGGSDCGPVFKEVAEKLIYN